MQLKKNEKLRYKPKLFFVINVLKIKSGNFLASLKKPTYNDISLSSSRSNPLTGIFVSGYYVIMNAAIDRSLKIFLT